MANEGSIAQWNNPAFLEFWKSTEPSVLALSMPLFAALAPVAGERILDIGCGGGLTTIQAAAAVGPGGTATGVDISEELLALARGRAKEAGTPNAAFVQADAQTGEIPGGPFDAATSRLGVMFFAEPTEAFANIRRHLKPGARLVFVCFQATAANPWYPAPILEKYAPPRPESPYLPPSPFALGEEERTRRILEGAGFGEVSFAPFVDTWHVPDALVGGKAMLAAFRLSPERQAEAEAELAAHGQRFAATGNRMEERHMWVVRAKNG